MNKLITLALAGIALAFAGCATTGGISSSPLLNPNSLAKGAQAAVSGGLAPVLVRNPSYAGAISGAADALVAAANSDPSALSVAALETIFGKTGLPQSDVSIIVTAYTGAQAVYLAAFEGIKLPSLSPMIQLFLIAAANGIYQDVGHPLLALPVVPWPPPTPPATPSTMASPAPLPYYVIEKGPDGMIFVDKVPASVVAGDRDPGPAPETKTYY